MNRIIESQKSVIVATDVSTAKDLAGLAKAVQGVDGIGGFKLGLAQGLDGLRQSIRLVRNNYGSQEIPIIYDHQKAGNDIPVMGEKFAGKLKSAGVTAAILFPFTGPQTQEEWTKACLGAELQVLTGGVMTHPKFLTSEGGYIPDGVPERIYHLACDLGVSHFVVPGNKVEWVKKIRSLLMERLGKGNFVLYAPGFITQKGDISECGEEAGDEWHAIVGSGIYGAENIHDAAVDITKQVV